MNSEALIEKYGENLVRLEAERTILGSMMLDGAKAAEAVSALLADDFALETHRRMYAAMWKMLAAGGQIDEIAVCETLRRSGELNAIGGIEVVLDIVSGTPRNVVVENHVQAVLAASMARKGIRACQQAIQSLLDPTEGVAETLDVLTKTLTEDRPDTTRTAAEVLPEALGRLERGEYHLIPTGIEELDAALYGGLRTQELTIIGAQPSAGKSALCRQIERRAAAKGTGIHAFSIEVSDSRWLLHHTARIAGIPAWKLRQPEQMGAMDKQYMHTAAASICGWNYRIDDAGGLKIEALLSKARLSAMRHGTKLFTVDYLQLLITDEANTHREMSRIAKRLKQFAKDYDVAVLALSQLKRGGDINKRPTVQDLKESGDLEAAADVVILNYRPKDVGEGRYTGMDELILGKQREGDVGAIPLYFNADTLTFGRRP